MKNPKSPCRDRSRGFIGINSPACRLTAAQADANGKLVGVTVNVRSGYCGVMVNGVVTAKKSGDIALGYTKLVYTAAGIAQSTTGREHLVLSVTDDAVTFIL